ncbi:MAG: hypothetical protein ACJA1C_002205 [Crocinitomicaceae bacterium]|jgi:uncharacterized protein with ATP-grasp and redox domains
MKSRELEEKVLKYLESKDSSVVKGSVSRGIMKDAEIRDRDKKDMHVIAYLISAGAGYEDMLCYVYADAKTDKLEFMSSPNSSEFIYE